MKTFKVILSLGLAGICAGLAGCSKPKDVATRAGVITSDSASDLVPMKIKWTTGKRYDEQMSMVMNTHMSMPGMPKPMDQEMTMTQNYSVAALKDLPEGGNELALTFTSEKLQSKTPGQVQFSFDTDEDPKQDGNNPVAPMMRKMIGAQIKFQTDTDGKVIKVLNYDEFVARFATGNPQMQGMITSMMNEDMIKHMGMPGQGLPDKPVKIGDHWPLHTEVASGPMGAMKLELNIKYTFKGWQQHDGHKCAVLGFVGDLSSKPAPANSKMTFSIDNGTMLGDSWFNPDMGMVVDTVSEQDMNVKTAMGGKTMNMAMKQKIGIKLVEVADIAK